MELLYIEPKSMPADEPLIDELTKKMVGALRNATDPGDIWLGVHECICGALSESTDRILPNGWKTNTLCVDYLAYHRAEVPPDELEAVEALPPSAEAPSSHELHGGTYKNRMSPIDHLGARYEARSGA